MSPTCPHCSSSDSTWKAKAAQWECSACEERFDGPAPDSASPSPIPDSPSTPPEKPKVFLSYGRKDASEIAIRLEKDLQDAGFDVWRDQNQIRAASEWQHEIEDGLRSSQVVVSLLSPHAVRRAAGGDLIDSICLDELSYARTGTPPTPIVPAMVEPCEPPFIIYRLDYVHMMSWKDSEDAYQVGLKRLIEGIHEALGGKVRYRLWEDRLKPLDFTDYLASKRRDFTGREWLFEEIDLWRFQSDERAFLITGDPGSGKSALVAQLAHMNPGGQVIACHCCQANEAESLKPARFIQGLAAMIASKLPAYAEQLDVPAVRDALAEQRCENDPGGAFTEGILRPLHTLPAPEEGIRYILVDALDEALLYKGNTNIVEVLASRLERLPAWMRIVATTRNERAVLQRLSGLRAKSIASDDPRNRDDLEKYITGRLTAPDLAEKITESRVHASHVTSEILQRSHGNFLYAVNVLEGIRREHYSVKELDLLPRGLDAFYLDFFKRIFGSPEEQKFLQARPVIQVLVAAEEPLSTTELAEAASIDADDDLPRLLRGLAQLLRRGEGDIVSFYHKSVADWLASPENEFHVNRKKGEALLSQYCAAAIRKNLSNPPVYVRRQGVGHFITAADWESACMALSSLEFLAARARSGEITALQIDYRKVLQVLPEAQPRVESERSRQTELDRWTRELSGYSQAWTERQQMGQKAQDLPEPVMPRPPKAVERWSDERIGKEIERILIAPTRLDIVEAFSQFTATNAQSLVEFSDRKGFVAQHAYNSDPAGPVHDAATQLVEGVRTPVILRNWNQGNHYNPLPACVRIMEYHTEGIRNGLSVSLSADGRRAISGSDDKTLRVWDLESGECLKTLEGHTEGVLSVSLSADGRRAISGSSNATLRVWDLESGECLKTLGGTLEGHTDRVTSVSLSTDGRRAISGSYDNTLRVWDLESGECLKTLGGTLEGHTRIVTSVSLSADGRRAISGSDDKTLRVWDLESGECLKTLEGHTEGVLSVSLSADGRRAISGSGDKTLRVWDLESGECLWVMKELGFSTFGTAGSGRALVIGCSDGLLKSCRIENLDL